MDDALITKFLQEVPEADNAVAVRYLEKAEDALLSHLYYLRERPDALPEQYAERQVMIAVDLYNKIGAEGELSHSENGISRSYESSWISKQLLNDLPRSVGSW